MERFERTESFCCGCSLKTGVKIIGWISLIASIALLIVSICGIIVTRSNPSHTYWLDIIFDKPTRYRTRKDYYERWAISLSLWIGYSITCFYNNVLLLCGVYMMKKKLMYIHLLTSVSIIGVTFGIGMVAPIVDFYNWRMITIFPFLVYNFFITNSFYFTME